MIRRLIILLLIVGCAPTTANFYIGMTIEEFEFFGASKHTMDTFLNGYDEFIQIIRSRMINR